MASRSPKRPSPSAEWRIASPRFVVFVIFAVLVALGGGSSRAGTVSLVYLRPAAVLAIGAMAIAPGGWTFRPYRPLFVLLALFAGAMAIQLVPLPPVLAAALPSHDRFAALAALTGERAAWHGVSITPDLTINSLLALLPALVVLVAFAGIDTAERGRVIYVVLGIALASVLFGVLQLAGGKTSAAYLYAVTSTNLPVGLLANRNHQAALLAIGVVAAAAWFALPRVRRSADGGRLAFSLMLMLTFVVIAVISGSRAGLILAVIALGGAGWMFKPHLQRFDRRARLVTGAALLLIALTLVAMLIFGRALAVDRLAHAGELAQEQRIRALPLLLRIAGDWFPFGSGFGSFDSVYRMYEADGELNINYFNNAHDDYLELAITGGLPALAVAGAALVWFARAAIRIVAGTSRQAAEPVRLCGWVGIVAVIVLLVASVTDYPVRTPILTFVAAIALAWIADAAARGHHRGAALSAAPDLSAR